MSFKLELNGYYILIWYCPSETCSQLVVVCLVVSIALRKGRSYTTSHGSENDKIPPSKNKIASRNTSEERDDSGAPSIKDFLCFFSFIVAFLFIHNTFVGFMSRSLSGIALKRLRVAFCNVGYTKSFL